MYQETKYLTTFSSGGPLETLHVLIILSTICLKGFTTCKTPSLLNLQSKELAALLHFQAVDHWKR